MFVRLSLSGLLLISIVQGSDNLDLDSLKAGLKFFEWKKIELELNQIQYNLSYNSNLSVSFIDSSAYLIESIEQDIYVSGNTIKTFNKQTNQLIIDERLPDDKDVFAILSGDLAGISLANKRNEKGLITFAFSMQEIGMNGSLSVIKDNWHFDQIHIYYDKDNWITLQLHSWQLLRGKYSFDDFGNKALDVIDLRE